MVMLRKPRNIKVVYIVIFSAMILLLIGSQITVQFGFEKRSAPEGLSRTLIEKSLVCQEVTTASVFMYLRKDDAELVDQYKRRLERLLTQWESINDDLQNENSPMPLSYKEGQELNSFIQEITPFYNRIVEEVKLLSQDPDNHNSRQSVESILNNQDSFLQATRQFVFEYQTKANAEANDLNILQACQEGLVLLLLFFEFTFIFIPVFRRMGSLDKKIYHGPDKGKIEQEKIKLLAILQGEEQERGRISMELHDGVGQWLTAMKIHLKTWEKSGLKKDDESNKALLKKLTDLLEGTNNEIKRISNNLTPKLLNDFGLTEAIRNLTYTIFGETEIKTDLNISLGEKRYNDQVESFLFRMVQEILNNIGKHAEANRVILDLFEADNHLFLNVKDNGKGFDLKRQESQKRITGGLMNIRSRTQLLNGDFDINTAIGKGCEVLIKIPID